MISAPFLTRNEAEALSSRSMRLISCCAFIASIGAFELETKRSRSATLGAVS